jgi:hypothetical protein
MDYEGVIVKRIVTILVLGLMLIMNMPILDNATALETTNDPTATGELDDDWTNPTNAYSSDDSYASVSSTSIDSQDYYNYGFTDMGTLITQLEIGYEYYINRTDCNSVVYVSNNGGTTYSAYLQETPKNADDDSIVWLDVTDAFGDAWVWDEMSNDNFRVKFSSSPSGSCFAGTWYLDYIPVRITTSTPFNIEIREPLNGHEVQNIIDLIAFVDTAETIDQVTFQISGDSLWYVATYDSTSDTYRYLNFDTRMYSTGSFYTLTARANASGGRFALDTAIIYINNQNQGCTQDENGNWQCPSGGSKPYPPERIEENLGDGTIIDPFYTLIYTIEASGTGTSVNFEDARISTSDTIKKDWLHVSNYDYSNRVWYNTSSTILQNTTYLTYYSGGGGQETWVNSSVSVTGYRFVEVKRVRGFNWTYNQDTRIYTYSLTITNSLSYTMDVELLYVGVAPNTYADPKTITVKDVTNNDILDNGQDFRSDFGGFHLAFDDLTSGSSREFTYSYTDFVEGSNIITPTLTIYDPDVQSEPSIRSGHSYILASKTLYQSNPFDYSGRMTVTFQTSGKPVKTSMIVEDGDGSVWCTGDCLWEGDQLIVQDLSLEAYSHTDFYFFYDIETPDDIADWASIILPYIVIILGLITLISLVALITKKYPEKQGKKIALIMIGSFFFALILGFVAFILPKLT